MKTRTQSFVTHRTHCASDEKKDGGGRDLLIGLFDEIHSDGRVGKLVAQFGIGGSISSLVFEETETIRQQDIKVEPY